MKNKILAFLSVSLMMGLASCESFLDQEPESSFTGGSQSSSELKSKYKDANEAQADLNGAYSALKSDIFQLENYTLQDVRSDNCYLGSDDVAEEPFDYLTVDALNSKVSFIWGQYYALAGAATTVIENTRLMDESIISESERNRIMAEGKFIRAFAYFDIVRLWGAAPLMVELLPTITADNLDELYPIMYPARSSVDDVYNQIVEDLNWALPYLKSQGNGSQFATKGAAYATLAKVYATKGAKNQRDYNKVVSYCDSVQKQGYSLVGNYDDLWQAENKFTKESILELYFDATSGNWAYWVLLKDDDQGTVTWRRYCTPTHELMAKYENGDVRKESTWTFRSVPYQVWYPSESYPLAYKIREKSSEIILIRLADVLLLKAEALVELNKVSDAITIVNDIRKRAKITNWELNKSMSQANARLAVEKERQLELCMEGQRWFDLVRTERMVDVMSAHKSKDGKPFLSVAVKPWMSLLNIPQNEMDLNANLTQNEGY